MQKLHKRFADYGTAREAAPSARAVESLVDALNERLRARRGEHDDIRVAAPSSPPSHGWLRLTRVEGAARPVVLVLSLLVFATSLLVLRDWRPSPGTQPAEPRLMLVLAASSLALVLALLQLRG